MGIADSKFFRRKLTPTIGMFVALCYVKSALISIILLIIQLSLDGSSLSDLWSGTELLSYIVNIIFYLIVANYFRKGKSEFGYAYIAMLILTISTYIIPFIFSILEWFYFGAFGGFSTIRLLLLISIILGSLLGITYFICMTQESKTNKKTYNIAMIIVGILITAIALYTMIVDIYDYYVNSFQYSVINVIILCVKIYSEFILFLFSFLYLLYAYDVYRIRTGKVY